MYPYPTVVRSVIMQKSNQIYDPIVDINTGFSLRQRLVNTVIYQILSNVLLSVSFPYIEGSTDWIAVYANWILEQLTNSSAKFPDFKATFSLKDSDFVELPEIIKRESGLPGNAETEWMAFTLLIMWIIALIIEITDLILLDPVISFIRFRVRSFAGTVKLCVPLELTGGGSANTKEGFSKSLKVVDKNSALQLNDEGKEISAEAYYS